MRKQSKLALTRTTVARLSPSQLARARGGEGDGTDPVKYTNYKCNGAQCTYDESGCVFGYTESCGDLCAGSEHCDRGG